MCFSATASFGSAAILTVVGIATINKSVKLNHAGFAAIPIIFAFQQFAEGFVWLSFTDATFLEWRQPAAYVFLFFAQVVWPVLIPFSVLMLEKNERRRNVLCFLSGAGLVLAVYLGYCLATYKVSAATNGHHLRYLRDYPAGVAVLSKIFFGLTTVLSPLISSMRRVWLIGFLVGLSYILTAFLYKGYILSTWCFFSAVISMLIYVILNERSKVIIEIRSFRMEKPTYLSCLAGLLALPLDI